MEQIYKNLYKDEDDYFIATKTNTVKILEVNNYLLCHLIEILSEQKLNKEDKKENDKFDVSN